MAHLARLREPARHVIRILRTVEVRQVAGNAARQRDAVVVVLMAVGARTRRHRVHSGQREAGRRVIELGIRPEHRVVALFARRREARMRHRRRRAIEVGLVTRNTGRHRDVVVVIDVAVGTRPRRNSMRARQRETRRRVIELRARPRYRVVTLFAGRREAGMRHRRCRAIEVGLVAGNAGRHRDVVVVIDVAVGTRPRRHCVRARQREARRRVIELSTRPRYRVVTLFAGRREARMRHRRCRAVEVGLVAGNAGGHRDVVVVVEMAVRAYPRRIRVRAHQREAGLRVVERGICPLHRVVTLFARRREAGMWHGRSGVVEVGLVARNAGGHRDLVVVVDMAIRAHPRRIHVRAGQWKVGLRVVKGGG